MTANEQFLRNRPLPGAKINFSHPLAKDLVACWLFNENGGNAQVFDYSPYGNHLALAGFVSPYKRELNGLKFGGAQYLTKSVSNFRSGDSQGAIEVWFRSSSTNNQILVGSADEGTNTHYLIFEITSTGVLSVRQVAADTQDSVKGTASVIDGSWHHAVLSSSGTAWTIILDGVAETLSVVGGSNTGDWFADTTLRDNLYVGAIKILAGINAYTTGSIGFVRIYSRPKSLSEARALYQTPYDMFLKGDDYDR